MSAQQCQCSGLPKQDLFVEGMLPAVVTQIGANCASEVHSCRQGVLGSTSRYGVGYSDNADWWR
jgi:hypothetical protein